MSGESTVKNKSFRSTKSVRGWSGKGQDDGKKKSSGDIEDLGNHVYLCGRQDHGEMFLKTTDAIAEYVGKMYSREMRWLVKYRKETEFSEPERPDGTRPSIGELEKYRAELKRYYDRSDSYGKEKAKVFVVIKGQCTRKMKNKVENLEEFKQWEQDDDVVKLLDGLQSLLFASDGL